MTTLSALFLLFHRGNFIDVFLLSLIQLSAVTKFSILIPNQFFFSQQTIARKSENETFEGVCLCDLIWQFCRYTLRTRT